MWADGKVVGVEAAAAMAAVGKAAVAGNVEGTVAAETAAVVAMSRPANPTTKGPVSARPRAPRRTRVVAARAVWRGIVRRDPAEDAAEAGSAVGAEEEAAAGATAEAAGWSSSL